MDVVNPLLMLDDMEAGTTATTVVAEVVTDVLSADVVAMLEDDVVAGITLLLLVLTLVPAQTGPFAVTLNALLQFSGCPACRISRPYSVPGVNVHGSGVQVYVPPVDVEVSVEMTWSVVFVAPPRSMIVTGVVGVAAV